MQINEICHDWVSSVPAVYFKLRETLEAPDHTFDELATIISSDPALTVRLLKIVNSPFYGFESKIETVTHALNIIGTEQLSDLVLAVSVMDQFQGIPAELVNMNSFWRHSIATGVLAKILARDRNGYNAERFYVAGMLHDLGSLAIYKKSPQKAKEALERSKQNGDFLFDSELKVLSFDHADVGGALLAAWKIPQPLIEAVVTHNHPEISKTDPTLAAIVHVADRIAYNTGYDGSGESQVPPFNAKALEILEIEESYLKQLGENSRETIEMAIDMFL